MDWSALEAEQEESLMTEEELEAFMASLECSSEGSDCVDGPPFFSSPLIYSNRAFNSTIVFISSGIGIA